LQEENPKKSVKKLLVICRSFNASFLCRDFKMQYSAVVSESALGDNTIRHFPHPLPLGHLPKSSTENLKSGSFARPLPFFPSNIAAVPPELFCQGRMGPMKLSPGEGAARFS
jgi:hypothetical protein